MEQHLQFLRCLEISFHILDAKQPPTKAPKCKKEAFSQIQKAVSGWKKIMTMWVDGKMRQTRNVNKNMYENMLRNPGWGHQPPAEHRFTALLSTPLLLYERT